MSTPKKTAKKAAKKSTVKKAAAKKTTVKKAAAATPVEAPNPVTATDVSMETLISTIGRAVVMLRAIGTSAAIRIAMGTVGYDTAEHQSGWNFVHAASGFVPAEPETQGDERETAAAIARLDASDEDAFRIVKATLQRRFPAQATFVLSGIGPSQGAAAVVGMRKLLDRLDALDHDPERAPTRSVDHQALALLAKRGITAEYRAKMRGDVRIAERLSPAPTAAPATVAQERSDEDYIADLEALRAWFEEWSELARVVIKRRDLLIRMGLAKRKPSKGKGGGEGGTGGGPTK